MEQKSLSFVEGDKSDDIRSFRCAFDTNAIPRVSSTSLPPTTHSMPDDWKTIYDWNKYLMTYLDSDNDWTRCKNPDQATLLCFAGLVFDPNQNGTVTNKMCMALDRPNKIIAADNIRKAPATASSVFSNSKELNVLCLVIVKILYF